MIPRGALCIVVRTAWPDLMGKCCTCIGYGQHPFGSHIFEFQDGRTAYGEPRNVKVITPPDGDVTTSRPREVVA